MHSDATIIGAGPAGSLAACILARNGWDVTLIEQHRFPRDKVCGESLSALGIDVLSRLGLKQRVEALGPTRLIRTVLHSADGRQALIAFPTEMWGVSRRAMDQELLEAAREAGARVLQPARCESIAEQIKVRHLDDNRVEMLKPTWVILADGKGALLPQRPAATTDFGIKAHFVNVDSPHDAVELFGLDGHYVGVAPIENERTNVAFALPVRRIESFKGDLDAVWRDALNQNEALRHRFARAHRISEWLAAPLPRFGVARKWPGNVIPLGNSAAALEPIGGEGMGLAMRSAELAANALHQAHTDGTPLPVKRLQTEFKRLWKSRSLACRALARLLSAPKLAGGITDWAQSSESLTRAAMAWMGKA